MTNEYVEEIKCWNCLHQEIINIPKGTTIEEYNDKFPCKRCGCNRRLK